MARDPFAAEAEASGLVGAAHRPPTSTTGVALRIVTAAAVLALLGLAFAYYLPLRRAHLVLGDKHRALNSEFTSTSEQLKKTTEQLLAAQSERDSLSEEAAKHKDARSAAEEKVGTATSELEKKLSSFIKSKQVSIEKQSAASVLTIDEKHVFKPRDTTASPQGKKLLCEVAKAVKSLSVASDVMVAAHTTDSTVRDVYLKREYATTWQLTAARAAGAAIAMDGCGLSGNQVAATGYAHHRPVEDAPKNSTGQIQIVVTPRSGS